jgi:hypothetical protein
MTNIPNQLRKYSRPDQFSNLVAGLLINQNNQVRFIRTNQLATQNSPAMHAEHMTLAAYSKCFEKPPPIS